ncbi:MAG: PP2C family protein-serine/threonine phosphatase [Lachnospiraceae bacterium]
MSQIFPIIIKLKGEPTIKRKKTRYHCAQIWQAGKCKKNEDAIGISIVSNRYSTKAILVVCDGIGGLEEGEIASGYVVEEVIRYFCMTTFGIRKIKKLYQQLFLIDMEIKKYGERKGIKLGSTCLIVFIENAKFYALSIGDCMLYKGKRNGKVKQIFKSSLKNQPLQNAIGIGAYQRPLCKRGVIKKEEYLLLCSDGFHYGLTKNEIELYFKNMKEEDMLRRLETVKQLKIAGNEKDDISAILCRRKW